MNKEDIIRMAQKAGWDAQHAEFDTRIQTFAKLVAQYEREACAEVAEEFSTDPDDTADRISVEIRVRG
jgi:hypothetical protein